MSTSRDPSPPADVPRDWTWEPRKLGELATPEDTARGLFFNSMLESVRALGDEAAMARCQEVLGGHNPVAFFNYPITQLVRLSGAAVAELSDRYGGPGNAARMLGRRATADFLSSAVGNAVRMMAGKDIKLFMSSVQTIYRMAASYGERRVEWYGPTRGQLVMRRNFMPVEYHEGVLEELFARYAVKNVTVRGRRTAPLDSVYDFSWE